MDSVPDYLLCGICTKLFTDPFKLPCGHSFCLRPCLLSDAEAVTARCVHCHVDFNVDELRPDYHVVAEICLLPSRQNLKEKIIQREVPKVEGIPIDEEKTCDNSGSLPLCGKHNKLSIVEEDYFADCALKVRIKLKSISRQKQHLNSLRVEMTKAIPQTLETVRTMKEGISADIENVLSELFGAANTALAKAEEKVDDLDSFCSERLGTIAVEVTKLLSVVDSMADILASVGSMNLEDAIESQKLLQEFLDQTASLKANLEENPSPLTRMSLSGAWQTIENCLNEFNILTVEDIALLSLTFQGDNESHEGKESDTDGTSATAGDHMVSKVKLYVGGLEPTHTNEHLRRHFSLFGTVTGCQIARDFRTHESLGWGFVTFAEASQATRALSDSPHFINEIPVHVRPFRTKRNASSGEIKDDKAGCKRNAGGSEDHKVITSRVFVGNLKQPTTQDDLNKYFSRFGHVLKVLVIEKRGVAFVDMADANDVRAIFDACPHELNGTPILVKPAYLKESKGDTVSPSGIPPGTDRQDILKYFSTFGGISGLNLDPNKNKVYITFATEEALLNAKAAEPRQFSWIELRVRSSEKQESSLKEQEKRVLYVGDISKETTKADLTAYFSQFGRVLKATVVGNPPHCGFVTMSSSLEAERAITSGNHCIGGTYVTVRTAIGKSESLRFRNSLREKSSNPRGLSSTKQDRVAK